MTEVKTAIVTGASRGLGAAIAQSLAENECNLILSCLENKRAISGVETNATAVGAHAISVIGDITQGEVVDRLVNTAIESFGGVDILVNCAGTIARADFLQMSEHDWDGVLKLNLDATMAMCKAVAPHMIERRSGKIVNLTSQMAYLPHPAASPSYEVSKSGVAALTRHLAFKFAPYNVCVNAVAPGSINTDLPKSMTEQQRDALLRKIPMGRLGEPNEVANVVKFLTSDGASYVTGSTVHVNGGSLML